ncbi:MAG: T9SS type A sorting domain-containing protein [Bacteroidota bacterium]
MNPHKILLLWCLSIVISDANAQTPPLNPFLVDSPFPLVHQNNYRQGFSELPALLNHDSIIIRTTRTPNDRVSPWLQLSERYPDSSRTIWGSTSTHIWKAISTPETLQVVSDYRIDFDPSLDDLSWSFMHLPNHEVLTYDDNRLLKFGDQDPSDPYSPIELVSEVFVPANIGGPTKLTRMYNGTIAFASNIGVIGLLNDNLQLLDTLRLPLNPNETAFHNDFGSDEAGDIFTITTERMMRLQISPNNKLSIDWEVFMDFGGNGLQGVGTTPTLLGTENDRLVCVINSKRPAEVIAFWRDTIPADWQGIPGQDRRVAAIVPLPGSGPISPLFTAVENSPVAYGYEIACGQWNGLSEQTCNTAKGVYKLAWDTTSNTMRIVWSRSDINLNNVLMYSIPDNLIYGSGREADCNYYYYGLDWQTGTTVKRFTLGNAEMFDDPGNANIILEDGSIMFNTKERLIQLYPSDDKSVSLQPARDNPPIATVYPNPVQEVIFVDFSSSGEATLTLWSSTGKKVAVWGKETGQKRSEAVVGGLAAGVYTLTVEQQGKFHHQLIQKTK